MPVRQRLFDGVLRGLGDRFLLRGESVESFYDELLDGSLDSNFR